MALNNINLENESHQESMSESRSPNRGKRPSPRTNKAGSVSESVCDVNSTDLLQRPFHYSIPECFVRFFSIVSGFFLFRRIPLLIGVIAARFLNGSSTLQLNRITSSFFLLLLAEFFESALTQGFLLISKTKVFL